MLKKVFYVILCVTAILSFCACSGYRTAESYKIVKEYDQISFTADGEITKFCGSFCLKNNSNSTLYHWGSLDYSIQVLKKGQWKDVVPENRPIDIPADSSTSDTMFKTAGILKAGEQTTVKADFTADSMKLKKGSYRIIKEVSIDKGGPFYIACGFEIE